MKMPDKRATGAIRFISRPPRVLLVFPTANLIHRQILNGILHYAHRHGPWEFHMMTELIGEQGLRRTREWGCTGVIALVESKARAMSVLSAGVPIVFFNPPQNLLGPHSALAHCCRAVRDQPSLGRTGALYFLDRHYTRFAFVGDVTDAAWSLEREKGFAECVAERGFSCIRYPAASKLECDDFGLEQKRLRAWLRDLPKPVALMAAWDRRARQILDTCMDAGLSVPQEIAVLGVDNDEISCARRRRPRCPASLWTAKITAMRLPNCSTRKCASVSFASLVSFRSVRPMSSRGGRPIRPASPIRPWHARWISFKRTLPSL